MNSDKTCEICKKELRSIELAPGMFAEHPELSHYRGRIACAEHLDELMLRVEREEARS